MDELTVRFWEEITARPSGPMALRFYIQPAFATFLAVRDGMRDARNGRPAFFWAVLLDAGHRREMLHSGWRSIGKLLCMAVLLDLVYQALVIRHFRPLEAIFIAALLGVVPYVLFRGPINRLLRAL